MRVCSLLSRSSIVIAGKTFVTGTGMIGVAIKVMMIRSAITTKSVITGITGVFN